MIAVPSYDHRTRYCYNQQGRRTMVNGSYANTGAFFGSNNNNRGSVFRSTPGNQQQSWRGAGATGTRTEDLAVAVGNSEFSAAQALLSLTPQTTAPRPLGQSTNRNHGANNNSHKNSNHASLKPLSQVSYGAAAGSPRRGPPPPHPYALASPFCGFLKGNNSCYAMNSSNSSSCNYGGRVSGIVVQHQKQQPHFSNRRATMLPSHHHQPPQPHPQRVFQPLLHQHQPQQQPQASVREQQPQRHSSSIPAAVTYDSSATSPSSEEDEEELSAGGEECCNRSTSHTSATAATTTPDSGSSVASDQRGEEEMRYYSGSTSLALDSDEDFLSPLHSFMRRYCVEAFSATSEDILEPHRAAAAAAAAAAAKGASSSHHHHGGGGSGGGGGRAVIGQVGIRCVHCRHRPLSQRQERAVCFPSSLNKIYHSIETWQRRHSLVCRDIPTWVKRSMVELMSKSKAGAGGRRQYWEESARRVGLADTSSGIRFISTPGSDATPSPSGGMGSRSGTNASKGNDGTTSGGGGVGLLLQDEPGRPVVQPEDRRLVTDYLFLLLEQMETCHFTEEDRAGGRSKVKDVPVGMAGIKCRHCGGKAGFGRYFPTTVVALTSANSDRNIFNHLLKCRRCPKDVQDRLLRLRGEHHQFKNKNRRGSRKLFFKRVWSRLHNNNQQQQSS